MLAMINLSSVFTSLTALGTGILQGMNAAKAGALIIISGVVLKIFANIFFIQAFGLDGVAYATLFVYLVLFIVNSIVIYRMIRFTVLGADTIKMIVASIVMGALVGLPTLWLDIADWSRLWALGYLIVTITIGGAIYFLLLWVMKAIHKQDLKKIPIIGKRFS